MAKAPKVHTQWLDITSDNGAFKGYLAAPGGAAGAPVPGVVVIQEIFGVNSHIRSVCERLAAEGYAALAPDLFWSIRPGIELGYTADDVAAGREYRGKIADEPVVEDVRASLAALRGRPETQGHKVGITGFCWGGYVTFLAACRLDPAASAAYYGGGVPNVINEADNLSAPIIFHFGEQDAGIPMAQVAQVQARMAKQADAEVFTYPEAGHGFHCDQRGSYHQGSAQQAWQRSLALFGKHLR